LLHGSWVHLAFNLMGLWVFGAELERKFGALWTAEVYGASVLWAAIAHVVLSPMLGTVSSLIGASGGLYGLLVAYGVAFPQHRLPLLPGVSVGARTFALSYAALELYLTFPSALPGAAWASHVMGNISHLAHLGGMAGGLMLAQSPEEAERRVQAKEPAR
jgi:membrane associated rhomboid family serine protease